MCGKNKPHPTDYYTLKHLTTDSLRYGQSLYNGQPLFCPQLTLPLSTSEKI